MAAVPFEFSEQFRMNLRRLRHRIGLSQEELACLASLHRTEIGLLEQGGRIPRIDTLLKLTASLEVTPNDLLDGIDCQRRSKTGPLLPVEKWTTLGSR